jgi:two-component SAPR family response regulator
MTPDLLKSFGISGYINIMITVVLMFCLSLYKRSSEKRQISFLKKQRQTLVVKTFGNFTLMYENKVVKFTRTKSEELIGYLIYKNGSSVKTRELVSVLYGDNADSVKSAANFRNLVVDVKHTLGELEIQNFFIAEYNNFRINPEVVKCDYYDFLAGEPSAIKKFAGEFMSQFSWAEETAGFLEQKALKKN